MGIGAGTDFKDLVSSAACRLTLICAQLRTSKVYDLLLPSFELLQKSLGDRSDYAVAQDVRYPNKLRHLTERTHAKLAYSVIIDII